MIMLMQLYAPAASITVPQVTIDIQWENDEYNRIRKLFKEIRNKLKISKRILETTKSRTNSATAVLSQN
jgi:hypothetical protein